MTPVRKLQHDSSEEHLRRVRRICAAMPGATERLSHGEPTFFVHKSVFAMFANNHHADGHIAVWIPVAPGLQPVLIESSPKKFFRPPYVGVRGWVGVELEHVGDEELAYLIRQAWQMMAPKNLRLAAQDHSSGDS
jgi:hypothetical protein